MTTQGKVKSLFRLNRICQEENYYMADFEFKMLGIVYHLDKGRYGRAFSLLNRLHHQLKTRQGLVKMPAFTDQRAELAFYRSLQNPVTGAFMDDAFPLRYRDELFTSILESLAEHPLPADDELDLWREWHLRSLKGIRTLTRYLWSEASPANTAAAKALMENFLETVLAKTYRPAQGAFSFYPDGERATIDGLAGLAIYREAGAFSAQKQACLWGPPQRTVLDLGADTAMRLSASDLAAVSGREEMNSLRLYATVPSAEVLTTQVSAVVYPQPVTVLDVVDLVPRVEQWLRTTDLTMGNWVSKAKIQAELDALDIEPVPVYAHDQVGQAVEMANEILNRQGEVVLVGFDRLQIPRCRMSYRLPVE